MNLPVSEMGTSIVSNQTPLALRTTDDTNPPEDETPWSMQIYLTALALIALMLLVFIAILYFVVQGTRTSGSSGKEDRKWITQMMWFVVAIVLIILFSSVVGMVVLMVVHAIERSKLFVPTHVSRYSRVSGKWYPLPGGGGLLHCTPNADPRARSVLFAHGNTFGLDPYASALDQFATCNYNIWALEYAGGYGMTEPQDDAPSAESLVRDIREAWAICGRDDAIIIGFSLGGALLGQVYDDLCPLPAQIVFLNTFWSVPALVACKLKGIGSLVAPLLNTQWVTKPPKRFKGKVTIVFSVDDDIVPPDQSAELCAIFASLKPACIQLPKGGHRWSAFCFMSSWCNETVLLPA